MNKDELNGNVDKLKGKVKQAVGNATDDPALHDEGVADEASGSVQAGFRQGPAQGRRRPARGRAQD